MKKSISQVLGVLFAVGLLAAVGWAAWLGLEQIVAVFGALDAQVARVTAIASVVVLLAALMMANALRQSGRDRLAVPLREEKAATYRLFVDCWQQRLTGKSTPAIEDGIESLDRLIALFGSEQMASVHMALRDLARLPHPAQAEWMPLLGGALLQIRKELTAEKVSAEVLELLLTRSAPEPVAELEPVIPGAAPTV